MYLIADDGEYLDDKIGIVTDIYVHSSCNTVIDTFVLCYLMTDSRDYLDEGDFVNENWNIYANKYFYF